MVSYPFNSYLDLFVEHGYPLVPPPPPPPLQPLCIPPLCGRVPHTALVGACGDVPPRILAPVPGEPLAGLLAAYTIDDALCPCGARQSAASKSNGSSSWRPLPFSWALFGSGVMQTRS